MQILSDLFLLAFLIYCHLQQKPSFELSGKLAAETNRVRGERLTIFNMQKYVF